MTFNSTIRKMEDDFFLSEEDDGSVDSEEEYPYHVGVRNSAEDQEKSLLYNGITRERRWSFHPEYDRRELGGARSWYIKQPPPNVCWTYFKSPQRSQVNRHIDMAGINARKESYPEAAGNEKVIRTQLNSSRRAALAKLQGVKKSISLQRDRSFPLA